MVIRSSFPFVSSQLSADRVRAASPGWDDPMVSRLHPNRAMPRAARRGSFCGDAVKPQKARYTMRMRRRRPLMRAALVGGVAYHAGKKVSEGREEDYDRDARIAELEAQQSAQQQPVAAAPAAPAAGGDMISKLEELARLKDQGILTQDEFDAQKQKLLGSA